VTEEEPQAPAATDPEPDSHEAGADTEPHRPILRVVKGEASPEELAALVTVVAALGGVEPPPRRRPPEWAANYRKTRVTLPYGPAGWRSSALPR
jgi:hypothetical protein